MLNLIALHTDFNQNAIFYEAVNIVLSSLSDGVSWEVVVSAVWSAFLWSGQELLIFHFGSW